MMIPQRPPPLAATPEWDDDDNWIPPPAGSRLSDLNAYLAAKTFVNKELKTRYPSDFDSNGNIRSLATRMPEDPAPVIFAHGVPWVVVCRDSVVLSGRQHAAQMAALQTKSDRNVTRSATAFSVGLIVAPPSFVSMQTFHRQLEQHAGPPVPLDPRFPKEASAASCDAMVADHTQLCYIAGRTPHVMRIFDLPTYHIFCGPVLKCEVHQAVLQQGNIRNLKALRQLPYKNVETARQPTPPPVSPPTTHALPEYTEIKQEIDLALLNTDTTDPFPPEMKDQAAMASMFASPDVAKLISDIQTLAPTLALCASLSELFGSAKWQTLLEGHDRWAHTTERAAESISGIISRIRALDAGPRKTFLQDFFQTATSAWFKKTPADMQATLVDDRAHVQEDTDPQDTQNKDEHHHSEQDKQSERDDESTDDEESSDSGDGD